MDDDCDAALWPELILIGVPENDQHVRPGKRRTAQAISDLITHLLLHPSGSKLGRILLPDSYVGTVLSLGVAASTGATIFSARVPTVRGINMDTFCVVFLG